MPLSPRQVLILDLLRKSDGISVSELPYRVAQANSPVARYLSSIQMGALVLADLASLEKLGLVTNMPGSFIRLAAGVEPSATTRSLINPEGKKRIGARAAAMVADGAVVILDSGTTTLPIAEALLPRHELTILTNDFAITALLSRHHDNRVLFLGGEVQLSEESCLSQETLAALEGRRLPQPDFAFVGVGGITTAGEATDFTPMAAKVRSAMLAAAKQGIVVADRTKLGHATPSMHSAFTTGCGLITDAEPAPALWSVLRQRGIQVWVARE